MEYELYLAVENIDHTRPKTRHPQTNGICERFHKTMLNEFYRVAFRKRSFEHWRSCRPISTGGRRTTMSCGPIKSAGVKARPPMQTFIDSVPLAKEKILAA